MSEKFGKNPNLENILKFGENALILATLSTLVAVNVHLMSLKGGFFKHKEKTKVTKTDEINNNHMKNYKNKTHNNIDNEIEIIKNPEMVEDYSIKGNKLDEIIDNLNLEIENKTKYKIDEIVLNSNMKQKIDGNFYYANAYTHKVGEKRKLFTFEIPEEIYEKIINYDKDKGKITVKTEEEEPKEKKKKIHFLCYDELDAPTIKIQPNKKENYHRKRFGWDSREQGFSVKLKDGKSYETSAVARLGNDFHPEYGVKYEKFQNQNGSKSMELSAFHNPVENSNSITARENFGRTSFYVQQYEYKKDDYKDKSLHTGISTNIGNLIYPYADYDITNKKTTTDVEVSATTALKKIIKPKHKNNFFNKLLNVVDVTYSLKEKKWHVYANGRR